MFEASLERAPQTHPSASRLSRPSSGTLILASEASALLLILPLMTDRITGSSFPVAFILILEISLLLAWVLIPWKVASAS